MEAVSKNIYWILIYYFECELDVLYEKNTNLNAQWKTQCGVRLDEINGRNTVVTPDNNRKMELISQMRNDIQEEILCTRATINHLCSLYEKL
jgi:hypothetical protein